MKLLAFLCLWSVELYAADSKLIPLFLEASILYSQENFSSQSLVWRKDLLLILNVFEDNKIDPVSLEKFSHQTSHRFWALPKADNKYDRWDTNDASLSGPEISLHALKLEVVEESDDVLNDDLYLYFFVTDGVVPSGKVTSIYKGLDEGDSFNFNAVDRVIFPVVVEAKTPQQHLIVDYGIMESDGDIKALQKLSALVVDIAITVYASREPQHATLLANLRQEVKALASLLLEFDDDDHLVTGSFGLKTVEIENLLGNQSYVEFSKVHKKKSDFGDYEYKLNFRLLKK